MKTIQSILENFHPISLTEMDGVKLLNRIDTKFVCTTQKLIEILNDLSFHYKILEINNQRLMSYRTKYYDTANFRMFRDHQNGKLNRYKVREREYVDSDLSFLEVKFKTNKSRTVKSRIVKDQKINWFSNKEVDFLDYKSPYSLEELEVKLHNTFQRITLCNYQERVTIDLNLKFTSKDGSVSVLPSLAIIEVKQDKLSSHSKIIQTLKDHKIRSSGFSKYCIGTCLVYSHVKSNRFKQKLLMVNKLTA